MIVKIHHKDEKTMIAVCDTELKGKQFEERELILDLSSEYYAGQEMTEEQTGDLLRNADFVNVVGEKSTQLALKEGIIEQQNITKIRGIPFAQAVIMRD